MKTLIHLLIIGTVFACAGCVSADLYFDQMQPDGSYRIITGTSALKYELAKEAAHRRAVSLCPHGYNVKTEFPDRYASTVKYQLIVKCREDAAPN